MELGIRVTIGMGWKPLEAHGTVLKPLLVDGVASLRAHPGR